VNYIYELPFGPGKSMLGNVHNMLARKALEGWQISGLTRLQSGSPDRLTGRNTFNGQESGVVLNNMTIQQLNDAVKIRKTTASNGNGLVYFLPQDLLNNSLAAWEVGGFTLADLDRSKPYIGPQMEAGKLGYRMYLYGPWQAFFNASLSKTTKIGESKSLEIRAQALNLLNSGEFSPRCRRQ
jgi:hypothetical protein